MNIGAPGRIVCFGEVLLRLSAPVGSRLTNAANLTAGVGGAEANVAAALAQLGHQVEMATALPRSALGNLCEAELRRFGVGTGHVVRSEGRLGLYFLEPGACGSSRVIYDREQSAFALNSDRFDWPAMARSAGWFHVSGISLALGDTAANSTLTAAEAFAEAGVPISFDVNHRSALWEGRSEAELARVKTLMSMAQVIFASAQDISRGLGIDVSDGGAAAGAAFEAFDRLQFIASTQRSTDRLSARIDSRDGSHETESAPLGHIIDRIGSGDAFAGGVIDGLIRRLPIEQCARRGLAAAVMKHSIAGDRWVGTLADLEAFDPFAVGDVVR